MTVSLTTRGYDVLQKAISGTSSLNFTKMQIGNGSNAGSSATALNSLKITMNIDSIKEKESWFVVLTGVFNNNTVTQGFHVTELGVWVEDPNDSSSEILYAYGYTPSSSADYVPSIDDQVIETEVRLLVYVGETASVTANIESGVYATKEELRTHYVTAGHDSEYPVGQKATAEGVRTIAVGAYTHAEGYESRAIGFGSHAEGNGEAVGEYSHAEGLTTKAHGNYSHAEGDGTTASDISAHAEGHNTTASGSYSHVEGDGCTASGDYGSHAEGYDTTASGFWSHAEGRNTTASNSSSHAEGDGTTAGGSGSHAEGSGTTASGDNSHAEGLDTAASKRASHAEGDSTIASNINAHAEGSRTVASGVSSHAEGGLTTASNECSHAEGAATTASGRYSHAEGFETVAEGDIQHVFGQYNVSNTTDVEIVGWGTSSTRKNIRTLATNGNMTIAGTLTQNSDARLKNVDGEIPDVSGIRAVRFKWNDTKGEHDDNDHIGYLAQEVETVAPFLVKDDSNGYKSLDYIALLCAKVEMLERRVEELEVDVQRKEGAR